MQLRGALDPQICPDNSEVIAYVSMGDIWVINTVSGHSKRLTNAHGENKAFSDSPLSAGVPSYVMQEEFSRYQGYWWQPQSDDGIYRILYEEVDESDVLLFKFPSSQPVGVDYEEYRFPRAGTPNAKSKLKLVQFTLSETLQIQDDCVKEMQYPLNYYFPWVEYVVRVGWMDDSRRIWVQLLNRQQNRLDLALISLDNFCEVCSSDSASSSPNGMTTDHSWQSTLGKQTSPIQVIYSQNASTWINVNDLMQFIEYSDNYVTFIWGAEETGYRHLYLVTASLQSTSNGGSGGAGVGSVGCLNQDDEMDGITLGPRILQKIPLTSGDWEVLGRNLWFDPRHQLVYFMGLRETPLEKHLYAVNLELPNELRLLTKPGYSYSIEFNDDCTIMIQVYCNIHQLPTCEVFRVIHGNGSSVGAIQLKLIGFLFDGGIPNNIQLQKFSPTIHSKQIQSGERLYAMVFRPHDYRPGQKYPTVLNVYGGPEVQTVNNTFKVSLLDTLLFSLPLLILCSISIESNRECVNCACIC